MDAFWQAVARPAVQARVRKSLELGLQQRSDLELRLGEYMGQLTDLSLASTNPSSDS